MLIQQRTKIVCTLGPASDDVQIIRRMIKVGVDVFRLNASHGQAVDHENRIRRIRQASRKLNRPVGIMLDLPGPKFRLSHIPGDQRILRKGDRVFLTGPKIVDDRALPIRNPEILKDIYPKHQIYLADGTVQLIAEKIGRTGLRCRVQMGGTIRSGSGLNLPDTELSIAVPTLADRKWVRFAKAHKVDWLAISFVQRERDIHVLRRLAGSGIEAPRLVAKIEKRSALRELEAIVRATDAVMVARGDLGVETPLAEVPIAQKRIIALSNAFGRPVITATQMLESMVEHPSPTRAEVADVANAILDGTDAVMLSAESAIGKFPVLSAQTLARVAQATEGHFPYLEAHRKLGERDWSTPTEAISFSAVRLAHDCRAKAILLAPRTKTRASTISRFRPEARIVSLCHRWEEACRETLAWGVDPLMIPKNLAKAIPVIRRHLQKMHAPGSENRVVMIQPSDGLSGVNSDWLRILKLE